MEEKKDITYTRAMAEAIQMAINMAQGQRHEFLTPEHVLLSILNLGYLDKMENVDKVRNDLINYIDSLESIPEDLKLKDVQLTISTQLEKAFTSAAYIADSGERSHFDITHFVAALFKLEDSIANKILVAYYQNKIGNVLHSIISNILDNDDEDKSDEANSMAPRLLCMTENTEYQQPLIGRKDELAHTMQVMCRKTKHNVLYVGEPGVGKTALAWGLAREIVNGEVPYRLADAKMYALDVNKIVSGASMMGQMEQRLCSTLDAIMDEGNAIVFIDNIHTLAGTGQTSEAGADALSIISQYMDYEDLRFVATTTYADMNRYLQKKQAVMRRFQQIDIAEPTAEETKEILLGIKPSFEKYHNIRIADDVIDYAIEMSSLHMTERSQPDKAIDVIDEVGALHELRSSKTRRTSKKVNLKDIDEAIGKLCRINAETIRKNDNKNLQTLEKRMKDQIYGQDAAIDKIVESIQMSKAGLLDEEKPIASLLFVGPTGVGKTEVARVLASEMGMELVRFDMSEYTEKHTVAKLIGSPAGYVGYEDGGLLTDAVRKSPNCVLLIDEIEKAHPDIYNILLQVMDYGRLTDSRGNKADFRRAVLIMTSNAGAQYASQASVGFGGGVGTGEAMLSQVRKTFKPEFINRLSGTIVFNDMDSHMANLILSKKLRQIEKKLSAKNITLKLSDEARQHILNVGFTPKYGAREMDRAVQSLLVPLLTKEILFGKLKNGGEASVILASGNLKIK